MVCLGGYRPTKEQSDRYGRVTDYMKETTRPIFHRGLIGGICSGWRMGPPGCLA